MDLIERFASHMAGMLALDDRWITVHPGGKGQKSNGKGMKGGTVVLLDDEGKVKAGMGGKFNGTKISEVKKSFTGPKTPKVFSTKSTEPPQRSMGKTPGNAGKAVKPFSQGGRASKDDIPLKTAVEAFEGTHHVPEKAAEVFRASHEKYLNSTYDALAKLADSPERKKILDEEFDSFADRNLKEELEYLRMHSGILSGTVAGKSGFKNQDRYSRRADSADAKMIELSAYREKAVKAIKDKMAKAKGPSESPEYVQKRMKSFKTNVALIEKFKAENPTRKFQYESYRKMLSDGIKKEAAAGNMETVRAMQEYLKPRKMFTASSGIWKLGK